MARIIYDKSALPPTSQVQPRLLYGSADATNPRLVEYGTPTGEGAFGRMDKWGNLLKLGEAFVDSDLGKGAMDLIGGGISKLGTAAEEAAMVAQASRLQDAAREEKARLEGDFTDMPYTPGRPATPAAPAAKRMFTPVAPPIKMMPRNYTQQAMQELESKLGAEYTKLAETAERSPDPRVVAAVDKRMKAIEAQLNAMKVKQDPSQAQGFDRSYPVPPAGSREMADAMARGMSAYTPKVAADDEQGALEAELMDSQLRRGGSIDQVLGRKPDTKDKRVEGGLSTGQAYQRAVDIYAKMLEDAIDRGAPEAEINRITDMYDKAAKKVVESRMLASGTPQELAMQKEVRNRLAGLDPRAYGEREQGATTPESRMQAYKPAGATPATPSMTPAQIETLRQEYVALGRKNDEASLPRMKEIEKMLPDGFSGAAPAATGKEVLPADKTATPAAAEDTFDLSAFEATEPEAVQDEMGNWTVQRSRVPSENDVRAYAAAANTAAKRKQVFELADKLETTPSSMFDFKDGGRKARLAKELDKLFPKEVDPSLAEYRKSTIAFKYANLDARQALAKSKQDYAERKFAWDKNKFAQWLEAYKARTKKAGKKGGDPLAGVKAAQNALEGEKNDIENDLKKIESAEKEADSVARKADAEAKKAAAEVGAPPAPLSDKEKEEMLPDDVAKANAAHLKRLDDYNERKNKAEGAKQVAAEAAKHASDVNYGNAQKRKELNEGKEKVDSRLKDVRKRLTPGS